MKGRVVHLGEWQTRRIAVLEVDGQIEDLLIDAPGEVAMPGAIWRGVIDRPLKGQGAHIIRLPEGATGFLRGGSGLRPGDPILVQGTSLALEGKAIPLTARVLFKSRYVIVTPGAPGFNISKAIKDDERRVALHDLAETLSGAAETGAIFRSVCAEADLDAIAADMDAMLEIAGKVMAEARGKEPLLLLEGPDAHALAWRDWPLPDAVEEHGPDLGDLAPRIEALLAPQVALPGGGHMMIEPTAALVAVDVNTGGDGSLAAGLKANIAVARALPRQLRCRGLSGQIVVDFAPCPKKERRQIEQALRQAFRSDPVETILAGWTPLGHFELQRRHERVRLAQR